ncbi:phosphatidylserine decarboxylase family protein [Mesonia sp. K4-1]|uniref:phosphatidylserine decarboxylase family protein n=1 Tax=Mesonia sp. K4-1 TaxID=2602760 RepID=UPI0011C712F0|nr:phosphatidylserine decarboxylase family protein [Mesonia sp. K4-1]TXK74973.1 phosphatidylserine decarboxylase family protein [Mesonia sp. K4-1]
MFHKEGYKILGFSLLAFLIINILSYSFIDILWLQSAVLIITAVLFLLVVQFFRNPQRKTVINDSTIVSPVDGKVVVIEEVFEKEFFNEKRLQVSVFMSPINVHVTRYPVNGVVTYSKYHPGKYLVAWHPKSSEENERTTVVVKNKAFGEILYRQVAGALAKRIVNYAKVNDKAVQGDDSGFIKFGSRVDLYLPLNTKLNVKLNEKVKGGVSVIAKQ